LLGELARLGLSGKTIVLFASDHGEMMGEHGMWFKRTFYEDAARVPLIVARPGAAAGRRIREVVSLVDLFPTLLDLAGLPVPEGLDGHSFAGALDAGLKEWKDSAIIEYLGEGAVRPMRALRRGRFKYVYVDDYPPLLFDLDADPHEQRNLAGQANLAATDATLRSSASLRSTRAELRAALMRDWDPKATTECVLRSQQERLLLREALGVGRKYPWDFQPFFDASKQYVREQDAQATSLRDIG
jgi:choline-sulfatase